jgi:hypothetical protein
MAELAVSVGLIALRGLVSCSCDSSRLVGGHSIGSRLVDHRRFEDLYLASSFCVCALHCRRQSCLRQSELD